VILQRHGTCHAGLELTEFVVLEAAATAAELERHTGLAERMLAAARPWRQ
jgi:hypothetical protein